MSTLEADVAGLAPAWSGAHRWKRIRHFVRSHPLFVIGLTVFLVIVVAALAAPWIATHDPVAIKFSQKLQAPSAEHYLGTDSMGRDIFSRVVYGARTSLMVGVVVVGLAIGIGAPMGLLAAYFGGRVDTTMMRIADVFLAFPRCCCRSRSPPRSGPGSSTRWWRSRSRGSPGTRASCEAPCCG